jgi:hypothetical protein
VVIWTGIPGADCPNRSTGGLQPSNFTRGLPAALLHRYRSCWHVDDTPVVGMDKRWVRQRPTKKHLSMSAKLVAVRHILVAHMPAGKAEAIWSRSSFYWAILRYKRQNATSDQIRNSSSL